MSFVIFVTGCCAWYQGLYGIAVGCWLIACVLFWKTFASGGKPQESKGPSSSPKVDTDRHLPADTMKADYSRHLSATGRTGAEPDAKEHAIDWAMRTQLGLVALAQPEQPKDKSATLYGRVGVAPTNTAALETPAKVQTTISASKASSIARPATSGKTEKNETHNPADGAKLLFIGKCLENTPRQSDFRYVSWGATREQVQRTEARTGPVWYEDEKALAYQTTFDSRSAVVSFFFEDNRLTEAVYALEGTEDDFAAYSRTVAMLSVYFSQPVSQEQWTDKSSKQDLDKNTAIAVGKLSLFAVWHTPRCKIMVGCWTKPQKGVLHSIRFEAAISQHN